MKIKKRKWMYVLLLLICFFVAWEFFNFPSIPDSSDYATLEKRAEKALSFAKKHHLNEKYALFVNYGIPSGKPRLFLWDFERNKVIATCHVMHGNGGGSTEERPRFSNWPGSKCSALGRFRVCKNEHGKSMGNRSYRIKGLDIDNLLAYNRGLMIHPAKHVNKNMWRKYIPLNEVACKGCVTVSSAGMNEISHVVNKEKKELLLWNFYSPED